MDNSAVRYGGVIFVDDNLLTITNKITDWIILYPHCPFDYCKWVTDHVSFPLNNSVKTTGQVCYVESVNQVLVSFLVIPNVYSLPTFTNFCSFLLPWLELLWSSCCWSVNSQLQLEPLMEWFYASIVASNWAIVFPPTEANILTVFISWVNLDVGVEVCFFNGMDEYSKT